MIGKIPGNSQEKKQMKKEVIINTCSQSVYQYYGLGNQQRKLIMLIEKGK